MIGQEILYYCAIFHGNGLPGEGIIFFHCAARGFIRAAKIIAGEAGGLRISIFIVWGGESSRAHSVAVVGECPG